MCNDAGKFHKLQLQEEQLGLMELGSYQVACLSSVCFFACLPVSLQPPASLCKPAFSASLSALGCLIRVTPRMAVLSLESLSVIACTRKKVCKTYITETHSTGFDSVVRGRGMRFYISNKFSNDSDYLGMQFENDGSI